MVYHCNICFDGTCCFHSIVQFIQNPILWRLFDEMYNLPLSLFIQEEEDKRRKYKSARTFFKIKAHIVSLNPRTLTGPTRLHYLNITKHLKVFTTDQSTLNEVYGTMTHARAN